MPLGVKQAAGLALAYALAGCAVGPDYHQPQIALPPQYVQPIPGPAQAASGSNGPSSAVEVSRWWHGLSDAELDSLVDRALKGNPDLDIALARMQQARTYEVVALGAALPRVDAAAGGGRGTGTDLSRSGRVPTGLGSADYRRSSATTLDMVAGFNGFWDIDLFGRVRREIEATRYDARAAAAARDAVQVAVIADVARTYLDLRGLQMQLAVELRALRATQDLLNFVQARFDRGITNELDVTLARRELGTLRALIEPLNAQIAAAKQQIAVLLGLFPDALNAELATPGLIPPMPANIAPGIPLDLIRRRPDVREAEWNLAGATARIGVATGALFPQLIVGGGLGAQGLGQHFRPDGMQHIWSVGYSAYFPLLDFGMLDAQIKVADLEAQLLLTRYKQTIQTAVQDVDAALAAYTAQEDRLASLSEAVLASKRATELATERYDRGLTDFLNVIDAQRAEYDLEYQFAVAQTSAAEQFVALYHGLGGGWEGFQAPPVERPLPAVMAMFEHIVKADYKAP